MALAEIHVTLKPSLFDAQGATILKALHQLGHAGVQNARIGKYITLELQSGDPAALQGELDRMCQQLLANPVIENYEITLSGMPEAPPVMPVAPPLIAPLPVATPTAAPMDAPLPVAPLAPVVYARRASDAPGSKAAGLRSGMAISNPFALDYATYDAMPPEAKLAFRSLALQRYGTWINGQLARLNAAWILCVGQEVVQSGETLDSYPSETHLAELGTSNNLVPWVFTRPPA